MLKYLYDNRWTLRSKEWQPHCGKRRRRRQKHRWRDEFTSYKVAAWMQEAQDRRKKMEDAGRGLHTAKDESAYIIKLLLLKYRYDVGRSSTHLEASLNIQLLSTNPYKMGCFRLIIGSPIKDIGQDNNIQCHHSMIGYA